MISNHIRYWLAAIYLRGIGPRRMTRWLEQFNNIEKLFLATKDELQSAGLNPKQIKALKNPDWELVERDLIWAEESHQHILTLADSDYPQLLKEIPDPPLVLFVRGNKSALNQTQLAIVGSRNATASGLQNAEQFAYHLAQSGLAITSGLALGIDGAAHRGTLNGKGTTIGVAGTGLNHLYPPSNRKLAEEMVAANGAVVSEFPLFAPPQAMNFPRRNRIISGLSIGVLVVEAAMKSGSLITVKHALDQGREVFAIPGSIHNPLARGCHHLIRQGAKLVETASDIFEELKIFNSKNETVGSQTEPHLCDHVAHPCATRSENQWSSYPRASIPHDFRQILDHIGHETTPIDMIILRSGLTPSEVSSILLKLELHGYVQTVTGGYVRATPN